MTATKISTQWSGDKIREARTSKRWSQQELADKMGCRMQTISEWENGKYIPQNAYQRALNDVFKK